MGGILYFNMHYQQISFKILDYDNPKTNRLSNAIIEIDPVVNSNLGNYYIERQDGNQTFYDVTFDYIDDSNVNINFIFNQTKLDKDNKSFIDYNYEPSVKEVIYKSPDLIDKTLLNVTVKDKDDKISVPKLDTKDGTKIVVSVDNKITYQYNANPNIDKWLKFGDNSIIIVWNASYYYNTVEINLTNQPNNISHLKINNGVDPYNSLIAYYAFDSDTINRTAYDYTQNNYDGTYTNGANITVGLYGSSGIFDGTNDYITLNALANTTNGTWCTWAKPNNNTGQYSLFGIVGTAERQYINGNINKNWSIGAGILGSGSAIDSGHNISLGIWQHLCLVLDGYNASIYKNGIQGPKYNYTQFNNAGAISIGWLGSGSLYFNGSIDDFMIFNKSLTTQQIQDIFNNQSARFLSQGTQEVLQFNISAGFNRINISLTRFEDYLGTNVSVGIGTWDKRLDYNTTMDGLVSYFNLDNNSNLQENLTKVVDRIYYNNGTVLGNSTYNSSVYDGGMTFYAKANYISIPDSTPLNLSEKNNFTLVGWVKPLGTNNMRFITRYRVATGQGYMFDLNEDSAGNPVPGSLRLVVGGGSGGGSLSIGVAAGLTANVWQQVAVSFTYNNATGMKFYKNGRQVGASQNTIPINGTLNNGLGTDIGYASNAGGGYLNGTIDEIMIFNRTLTSDEIDSLYVKGLAKWNYTNYQIFDSPNINYTFNMSNETTNILPSIKLNSDINNFYTPIVGGNIIVDYYNVTEIPPIIDNTYPIFYNYNNDLNRFNVTVNNTNGTVYLNLNDVNYTASNLTSNVYNVTVGSLPGIYNYYWVSFGNGSLANYNKSDTFFSLANSISNCSNLTQANTVYNLFNDINATGTCIIISNDNITLEGNSHIIKGDANGANEWGIYAENRRNITVRNITVTNFGDRTLNNGGGINYYYTNNSLIEYSNLSNNNYTGINFYTDYFNKLYNITTNYNYQYGIIVYDGSYGNYHSINSSFNQYGIYNYISSNNIFKDNQFDYNTIGLYLYGNNNSVTSTVTDSNTQNGLYLSGSLNVITKLIQRNCSASVNYACTYLSTSGNNLFNNVIINKSLGNSKGIWISTGSITNSSNNLFKDLQMSNISGINIFMERTNGYAINNTFLNSTFGNSSFSGINQEIIRNWYVDVYVNRSDGVMVSLANVSISNSTGERYINHLANAFATLTNLNVTQYRQIATTTFANYNNQSFNATKTGIGSGSTNVNVSSNLIGINQVVITINFTAPVPSNVTTVTGSTPLCNYKKFGYYNLKLPFFRQENCI